MKTVQSVLNKTSKVVLIGFLIIIFFLPVYWLILSSLSSITDLMTAEFYVFPKRVTLEAFKLLLGKSEFIRYIINSVLIAFCNTGITLVVSSLGGYGLARMRFFGRNVISTLILFVYVIPSVLLVIPLFILVTRLRIQNTYIALIMAYTTFSIPFCIWLLKGYFSTIPLELEDAARVDGLSRLGTLIRIIMPLSLPGLAAAAMFAFILSWNEFLFAFIFINEESMRTLPVGIATFWGEAVSTREWSLILSSALVATIPVLILYIFIQRYMIQGLAAGALKG
jgi:ABC-type glycerol-3-phosphate transport system permease component